MKDRPSLHLARLAGLAVAIFLGFTLFVGNASAAGDYSHIRIVRLSFVEGDVQYQPRDSGWQNAPMNLPIQEGFRLKTGAGYAEVEFESGLLVRLANYSSLEFTQLGRLDAVTITRLTLTQGTALVSAQLSRKEARDEQIKVSAGELTAQVTGSTRFRLDAAPATDAGAAAQSWVTVLSGKVDVAQGAAAPQRIGGGHTLRAQARTAGADAPAADLAKSPPRDQFDKWSEQRDQALEAARNDTSDYLTSQSYFEGFADLADFGMWTAVPGYGWGWMPYGMGANWMPYASGQWLFMDNTGWNWVSAEPWGWVPYHFGGWVNAPGLGWAWVPTGVLTWQPTTATWVTANNQLGWVAVPPPALGKGPVRAPLAPVVILAARGVAAPGGAIRPSGFLNAAQSSTARLASAPAAPAFVGGANRSLPGVFPGIGPAASLRAYGGLSNGPAALPAPALRPAPAARGLNAGFQGRGFAAPGPAALREMGFRSLAAPRAAPSFGSVTARMRAGGGFGYGGGGGFQGAPAAYARGGVAAGGGAAIHAAPAAAAHAAPGGGAHASSGATGHR